MEIMKSVGSVRWETTIFVLHFHLCDGNDEQDVSLFYCDKEFVLDLILERERESYPMMQ